MLSVWQVPGDLPRHFKKEALTLKTKRILSVILSLMMLTGLISAVTLPAYADADLYDLWVAGTRVTSENAAEIGGNGSVTFDAATATLTLKETSLKGADTESGLYGVINSKLPSLTVKIVGNVILDGESNNDGIDAAGGCSVTVEGGRLELKNAYYGTYIGSWDAPGGDLTLRGGLILVAKDTSCAAVWVNHDINILDATVMISRDSEFYNGMVSNVGGTITVNGGKVMIDSRTSAIHFGNTDASEHAFVLNSGTVQLTASEGYGIYVEPESETHTIHATLTMTGGDLLVSSAEGATNIPADNIALSDTLVFQNGTSLADAGMVKVAAPEPEPEPEPRPDPPIQPRPTVNFKDVSKKAWYYNAVAYTVNKGIFAGITATTFEPGTPMTRAMFVATLSRMAGVKLSNKVTTKFSDVKSGQWYTGAVKWASDNGIVKGSDGKFMPNDPITREQICTIFVTYAKYRKVTLKATLPAVKFKDAAKISGWAKAAVTTCQRAGLVAGSNGSFNPQGKASRAEVAQILMSYDKNFGQA